MAQALYTTENTAYANLLETAPVQSGATVSKPLVNTEALRQILFAMDAGQSLSEHRAPYVAVVHLRCPDAEDPTCWVLERLTYGDRILRLSEPEGSVIN